MKIVGVEYGKTFNQGNYESERITLKVDIDDTDDLDETYKTIKAAVLRLHESGKLIEKSKAVAESANRLEPVKKSFPKELADLLTFEESKEAIIIKTKGFLGSQNFAKIAAVVRDLHGEYVSAGKESHFKIKRV